MALDPGLPRATWRAVQVGVVETFDIRKREALLRLIGPSTILEGHARRRRARKVVLPDVTEVVHGEKQLAFPLLDQLVPDLGGVDAGEMRQPGPVMELVDDPYRGLSARRLRYDQPCLDARGER